MGVCPTITQTMAAWLMLAAPSSKHTKPIFWRSFRVCLRNANNPNFFEHWPRQLGLMCFEPENLRGGLACTDSTSLPTQDSVMPVTTQHTLLFLFPHASNKNQPVYVSFHLLQHKEPAVPKRRRCPGYEMTSNGFNPLWGVVANLDIFKNLVFFVNWFPPVEPIMSRRGRPWQHQVAPGRDKAKRSCWGWKQGNSVMCVCLPTIPLIWCLINDTSTQIWTQWLLLPFCNLI